MFKNVFKNLLQFFVFNLTKCEINVVKKSMSSFSLGVYLISHPIWFLIIKGCIGVFNWLKSLINQIYNINVEEENKIKMFETFIFLTFTNPQLKRNNYSQRAGWQSTSRNWQPEKQAPLPYKVANFFPHRLTHSINKRGNFTFSSTLYSAKHLHSFRQDERHVEASF